MSEQDLNRADLLVKMEEMLGKILYERLENALGEGDKLSASEIDKIDRWIIRQKPPEDAESEERKRLFELLSEKGSPIPGIDEGDDAGRRDRKLPRIPASDSKVHWDRRACWHPRIHNAAIPDVAIEPRDHLAS